MSEVTTTHDPIRGFRLSPHQRRLWRSQQGCAAYCAQCAVAIDGDLNVARLRASLEGIVDRHQILRTRFLSAPGASMPIQVVGRGGFVWRELDLSSIGVGNEEVALDGHMEEDRRTAFDLIHGPLLRVRLLRFGSSRHVLVLSLPAMCADSRTMANLVTEMRCEPAEVLQYAEYSEWQHQLLEDEDAKPAAEFWRRQSVGAAVELPGERYAGTAETFETACIPGRIESALIRRLEEIARGTGAGVSDLMLTVLHTLLLRFTGGQDVAIGCVVDGRVDPELERGIGLFARNVPVSIPLSPQTTFGAALRSVSEAAAAAYEWQDYFIARENAAKPAFPVSFEFDQREAPAAIGGLTLTVLRRWAHIDRFKLKLSCVRTADAADLAFYYDAGCFSAPAVKTLSASYLALLEAIAKDPQTRIGEARLLGETERRRLLMEPNRTAVDYGRQRCVHELLEEQAGRTPERLAVSCGDRSLTYRALNGRANRLAKHLRELRVGPEVAVGVSVPRSPELVVALLGILKAGGAYVPLEATNPVDRLRWMAADASVRVVVAGGKTGTDFESAGFRVVHVDGLEGEDEEAASSGVESGNLAYILYTSGSTGRPKGVMVSHRGVVNYLRWSRDAYGLTSGCGAPVHSPLGFDLTVTSLLAPLVAGQRVILAPEEEGWQGLAKLLREGRDYSLLKITPAHLELLREEVPAEGVAGLARTIVIGGEVLLGERLTWWRRHAPHTRLINEYGPTEAVVGCCVYEMRDQDAAAGPVPIGRPIANAQMYVLDGRLEPVPVGVVGELYIGGAGVARGYLNDAIRTAERFVPNPFGEEAGGRLYRTGDLGRWRADGELEFLGRTDEQVKVRGYRVEPGEIVAALEEHAEVKRVVVIARAGMLVAYVATWTRLVTAAALREFLAGRLPEYMLPSAYVFLDEMPLSANGKIDRDALPDPKERASETEYIAPRTPEELTLARIWSDVLGINRVGIHDNFFSLGGDSIRSVRIVGLAAEEGLSFSVQQIFQQPTIAGLVGLLAYDLSALLDELEKMPDAAVKGRLERALAQRSGGSL